MKKIGCIALFVLLCVILLTSCATANKLSDAEISAARTNYPQFALPFIEPPDYYESDPLATFQSVREFYHDSPYIVEVTVMSTESYRDKILETEHNPGMVVDRMYLIVHVDSVVGKDAPEKLTDSITLYIGTRENLGEKFTCPAGTKLIVPIRIPSSDLVFPEKDKFYLCGMEFGYYITQNNHVLAVFDTPGLAEMDGKTLDAFRQEVKNVF